MAMKRILTFLGILGAAFGAHAANPSFTDLVQTNILWVSKNGNNSTAKPGDPGHRYASISNAVQAAVAPAIVKVAPGLYNESVILRNGINLEMPSGVVVSQSVNGLPVLFDNGAAVTNSITGNAIVVHKGAGNTANGFQLSGDSSVLVDRIEVTTSGNYGIRSPSASIFPILRFRGKVYSAGSAVTWSSGAIDFRGEAYGTNDYGIILGDSSASNYVSGLLFAQLNSAVHIGGGFCMVENAVCISFDDAFGWGVEMSGGSGVVKNSILMPSLQEAVGKYGGNLLVLDGCQLSAGANATYSIDNDGNGSHGTIEIRGPCWANKAPNPAMNILSGSLIVSNNTTWKNPQIFKSVHDLTNIVARTNGNTWFPGGAASFSTTATNQIPVSGWTNNAEINVTVYVTATAVSFTVKNRSGTVMYTSPTLTATMPVVLQPGWAINAASGLTGTVLPW